MKTRRERRNRLIRYLIIGFLLLLVVSLFIDTPFRTQALATLQIAENLKAVQGSFSTVALTVVVLLFLIENAEKFHFIWEIAHKLLGYDLEAMAQHEREFVDLPEDYIQRPELEKKFWKAATPRKSPSLITLQGDIDSGKTTLLNYILPRFLNRRYKGAIINCRGDLESMIRELGEDEVQTRKRLVRRIFQRIIKEVEVPGDIGETVSEMREALGEHFLRERTPWLIIIDQIDDPSFLFEEVLPACYGVMNTVVLVGQHLTISDAARRSAGLAGREETVAQNNITMQPFTGAEAFQMLQHEVRKRKGRVPRADAAQLPDLLVQTTPGIIQRLSDIYANGGGLNSIREALDAQPGMNRRGKVIAGAMLSSIDPREHPFYVALSLIPSETVGETVLQAIAHDLCPDLSFTTLLKSALMRHHLQLVKVKKQRYIQRKVRYFITKLGLAAANAACNALPHRIELMAGAALLDHYRQAEAHADTLDLSSALPNILGMMTWCERVSRLPDADLIKFSHLLRQGFYRSGRWDVGMTRLHTSAQLAQHEGWYRITADLLAAQSRILLAMGKATSAMTEIAATRQMLQQSTLQMQRDQYLGIFSDEKLKAAAHYDQVQAHWVTHLAITTRRLLLDTRKEVPQSDALLAEVRGALAWLRDHGAEVPENQTTVQMVEIALLSDEANILIAHGDAAQMQQHLPQAADFWQQARTILQRAEQMAEKTHNWEALAQIKRVMVKLHRRAIQPHSQGIMRFVQRQSGVRHAIQSLDYARMASSPFEEALTYYENALLAIAGLPGLEPTSDKQHLRTLLLPALSPRWHRLDSAQKQLLVANATTATLGAQAHQFLVLMALVDVSRRLYALDGDPQRVTATHSYAQSAQLIATRLRNEIPHLEESLQTIPASFLATSPASAKSELVAAATRKRQ